MGVYSIKDLENFTQIKAHTLRIWEQRYNLLCPERTDTNIRYYSDRDLKKIININLLYNNGLKISKIAKLNENEIFRLANEILLKPEDDEASRVDFFINKIMDFDEVAIVQTLQQLDEMQGLDRVFSDLLIPVLRKIGELWQVDTINAAHEHFFSHVLRDYIIRNTIKAKDNEIIKGRVLLFLREGEFHELALVFYNYVLRSKGYQTIYLGQSLPNEDVARSIRRIKPDLIFTSLIAKLEEQELTELMTIFENNIDLSKIYMGGYQVKLYQDAIPSAIHIIHSIDDLMQL
jgi:MerR family transcriptional regulator, light-induced transcriptional regulator